MSRRPMELDEFANLLINIDENHLFSERKGKMIKYVMPVIDMRTADIHAITIHGMFGKEQFSITNENKDRCLKTMVYEWLEEEVE